MCGAVKSSGSVGQGFSIKMMMSKVVKRMKIFLAIVNIFIYFPVICT